MDITPLDYAKMLCESFKRSKELIPEEKIKELISEIQATFPEIPDKVARMYIELHNEAFKKRKRKRKRKKKVKKKVPKIKKETPKVEVEYTEEELKIKAVIDEWLDYWDREEHLIIHPITLVAKADLELECGYEKAWKVVAKMLEEGNLYVK